ncbi:MAG: hypothetical protein Q9227_001751 [Pyrenula ochraceoflavens]
MKPLVQVKCTSYTGENSSTMMIPDDSIRHLPDESAAPFMLPNKLNVTKPTNSVMDFEWVFPSNGSGNNALIGAVFRTYGWDSKPALHACGILAHWVPVNAWIDPTVSLTIYQDSPDPAELINSTFQRTSPTARPLRMSKDWLNSMNLGPFPSWHFTNLTLMESLGAEFGYNHGPDYSNCPGIFCLDQGDKVPWLLATSVSLYLADGLSRAKSGLETQTFRKKTRGIDWHDLNNYNLYSVDGSRTLQAALGRNSSDNTEVHWHTRRFGYGWGIEGSVEATFIVAAIALLLQALIALMHIGVVIFGGWIGSNSCDSMGEMVALALQSPEPAAGVLDSTSAGLESPKPWKETVRIQERSLQNESHARNDGVDDSGGIKYKLELHAGSPGRHAAD